MRVAVIGSGIAGLSTAIALRKIGMDVQLYERAEQLKEVGAGIGLWANALRALNYLGVGNEVMHVSMPVSTSELRVDRGRKTVMTLTAEQVAKATGYSPALALVHRAELVEVLAANLPPGVARYGHECTEVKQDNDRLTIRFKNGETTEADLLIAADGIHSTVRDLLFESESPRYSGYTCWRGVCPRPAEVSPGYIGEWWGRGKRFGITCLPRDRVYWFATANQPPGVQTERDPSAVADHFNDWAEPVASLILSTPADAVFQNDIFDLRPNPDWIRGRVLLVGDAAHATTPNLGQGGCMAVEDAVKLAHCLSTASSVPAALSDFVQARSKRTAAIVKASERMGRVGQWESPFACRIRDLGTRMMMSILKERALPNYSVYDVGPIGNGE